MDWLPGLQLLRQHDGEIAAFTNTCTRRERMQHGNIPETQGTTAIWQPNSYQTAPWVQKLPEQDIHNDLKESTENDAVMGEQDN